MNVAANMNFKAQVVEANLDYAQNKYNDEKEAVESTRHLAMRPEECVTET